MIITMKQYIKPLTEVFYVSLHILSGGSSYTINGKDALGGGNAWSEAASRTGDDFFGEDE
jgi:hypothetical protein